MCFFKLKQPSVANTSVTASQLLPSTETKEPETYVAGGEDDSTMAKRKGRSSLLIKREQTNQGYNPVNY